jgi:hypothetical protein
VNPLRDSRKCLFSAFGQFSLKTAYVSRLEPPRIILDSHQRDFFPDPYVGRMRENAGSGPITPVRLPSYVMNQEDTQS